MIKVGIRDFQVIERLSLPLEGIVAITGPSNNGKTSVARAIEACLYNWTGEHFINDKGAEECLVGLTFPESKYRPGIEVLWRKPRAGGASYTLNGDEFNKAGRSVLPELMGEGFAILETPRAKFPLQFWKQMEIFLVNESPSTVFDVLSRLLEDRKLIPVLKSMKDMISSGQKEAQKQEGQFQLLTESLSTMGKEKERYHPFLIFEPKILRMKQVRDSLSRLVQIDDEWKNVRNALGEKRREILRISTPLQKMNDSIQKATSRAGVLEKAEILMSIRQDMKKTETSRKHLEQTASVLGHVSAFDVQKLLTIENQAVRLAKLRSLMRSNSMEQQSHEKITEISDRINAFEERLSRIEALSNAIDRIESLRASIKDIEAARDAAEEEGSSVERSYQEFKIEAGVCPECGGLGFIGGNHEHD